MARPAEATITVPLASPPDFPHAACKGEPTDYWYPDQDLGSASNERLRRTAEARRICLSCVHRAACADWAIDHPRESYGGMWGGLDPSQLARIRQHKGAAA